MASFFFQAEDGIRDADVTGVQTCALPICSGVFRNGEGAYLVVSEIPQDREPGVQIALKVPDADKFGADPVVEVVTPFEETHYGTREMTVRDPDGRIWSLQAPAK